MSEGLPIFGKEVFDTLFIDYRIMVTFALFSIIMFLAGMYLQLAKWGQASRRCNKTPWSMGHT